MGRILELSPAIINQIAAGEVVERPASVVKELLENAIDAQARRIELTVERGGKDLVRVADDGCGMDPDDLLLAFRPHATSKLKDADELYRIRTLGFRGEALAAIAEVSRVTCQSRTVEQSSGSEIRIEGGVAGSVKACAQAVGTVIEVRNLFYNTPVRRTFLKADATEAGHVAEMFARVALAHPNIHFTYRSSGKIVQDLPPTLGPRDRVAVFFGHELADSLLWVESRLDAVHLRGYVSHPSQSRSSPKGQYLFVGGRYVRDRSLSHALAEAYRGLLMVGRYPLAFLFLDLPPEDVDVNVHPTKVEVRFRDGHRVYSQLLSTIRQTFLSSDLHARIQTPSLQVAETQGPLLTQSRTTEAESTTGRPTSAFELASTAPDRQSVASWFAENRPGGSSQISSPSPRRSPPTTIASPDFGISERPDWARHLPPTESTTQQRFDEFSSVFHSGQNPVLSTATAKDSEHTTSFERSETPPNPISSAIGESQSFKAIQVHDSYLIVEVDDGMVVIDQHALHERILYEELKMRIEKGRVESQRLLVPVPVDLNPADAAEVLLRREILSRFGLEISEFSGDTLLITSTPVMLSHVEPARLLHDLAEHFQSQPIPPTPDAILEDALNMIACKAAVKAGQRLSSDEVDALLRRRHLVANTHHCPHGRPTALTFTKAELERQFGRT